jgi:hypothetical protein
MKLTTEEKGALLRAYRAGNVKMWSQFDGGWKKLVIQSLCRKKLLKLEPSAMNRRPIPWGWARLHLTVKGKKLAEPLYLLQEITRLKTLVETSMQRAQ